MSVRVVASEEPGRRVELGEPLVGAHVLVDEDQLDMAHLAAMQSQNMDRIMGALARAIVGGNAVPGLAADDVEQRAAALGRLKPAEFGAIMSAVGELFRVPKRS